MIVYFFGVNIECIKLYLIHLKYVNYVPLKIVFS